MGSRGGVARLSQGSTVNVEKKGDEAVLQPYVRNVSALRVSRAFVPASARKPYDRGVCMSVRTTRDDDETRVTTRRRRPRAGRVSAVAESGVVSCRVSVCRLSAERCFTY